MSPGETAEEINYPGYASWKIESRTARAARYSEAPMLVGVMSVLASNDLRTEVVPRKISFRPHFGREDFFCLKRTELNDGLDCPIITKQSKSGEEELWQM